MKNYFLYILLLSNLTSFSQDIATKKEIATTLSLVNAARIAAGLDTVYVSADLSNGCNKHAKYLVINRGDPLTAGLNAHKESTTLKGSTPEGAAAGESSVIHFVKPSQAVDGWVRTFYHRIPLLQPNLKAIGIGYYEKDGYTVSLVDCISGVEGEAKKSVVYCPKPDQTGIPLSMGPEIPHPVGEQGEYGFPITICFTQWQTITNVSFQLKDNTGKEVACYVSTPEDPATDFTQWNSICAIPKSPLRGNTKYSVTISCSENGKNVKKTYSFQTVH